MKIIHHGDHTTQVMASLNILNLREYTFAVIKLSLSTYWRYKGIMIKSRVTKNNAILLFCGDKQFEKTKLLN